MMMFVIKVSALFVVLVVCCSGCQVAAADDEKAETALREQIEAAREDAKQLKLHFDEMINRFFTSQQDSADQLLANSTNSTKVANAWKKISYQFTTIQNIKYAMRRNSIEIAEQILESQAANKLDEPQDERLRLTGKMADLLRLRCKLRGLVDGFEFTKSQWSLLYLYLHRYVHEPELRSLVEQIFEEREEYGFVASQVAEQQSLVLLEILEQHQVDMDYGDYVLRELDDLIDEFAGCQECSALREPDEDTYNVYPMIPNETEMARLVEKYVGNQLIYSMNSRAGKIESEFSVDQVENVDADDIYDLHEQVMQEKGMQEAAGGQQ